MRSHYRRLKLFFNSAGQELPGWAFIIGLILGLFAIAFLVWLALKSGKATLGPLGRLK